MVDTDELSRYLDLSLRNILAMEHLVSMLEHLGHFFHFVVGDARLLIGTNSLCLDALSSLSW